MKCFKSSVRRNNGNQNVVKKKTQRPLTTTTTTIGYNIVSLVLLNLLCWESWEERQCINKRNKENQ